MNSIKGDPEQARRINRSLILNEVRRKDSMSRAELARALSISKMTVSTIVSDLVEQGLIVEQSSDSGASGTGGRPPVLLSLETRGKLVVGIDIGTTNTVLLLGNLRGERLKQVRVPTRRHRAAESIADQIHELLAEFLNETNTSREKVVGVGVSVAGLVDKRRGFVKFSPDFNWRDVHFRRLLEQRLRLPVVINNCTRVAALGEMWYGAARDVATFFYVNVGYGIGSAIVIDQKIYEHNSEFGHIPVTTRPVRCECGKEGCLEAVSSGHAIEREANVRQLNMTESWLSAKKLAEKAVSGDQVAHKIFDDAGKYLGRGIATVANLLSPQLVVVGGGVSLSEGLLMKPLMQEFDLHTMEAIRDLTEVVVSPLGMDAGIVGAMALALDNFVFQPNAIAIG